MIEKLQISLLVIVLGICSLAPVAHAGLGDKEVVAIISDSSSDESDTDSDEEPFIEDEFAQACENGSLSGFKSVLVKLFSGVYSDTETPLTLLAASKNSEASSSIDLLIDILKLVQGEETQNLIDHKTNKLGGGSALIIALSQRNLQTAHTLIKYNSDLDLVSNQFGKTPLMLAATETNLSVVTAIIEKYKVSHNGSEVEKGDQLKEFINKKAGCGLTALDLAEQNEGTEKDVIIAYLEALGAKKATPNSSPYGSPSTSPVPWVQE